MYIVSHHCPQCGGVSDAPMAGVMAGDAGIWVCDLCDTVFQIRIDFEKLDLDEALSKLKRTRVAQGARVDPKEPSPATKGHRPSSKRQQPDGKRSDRKANEQG